MPEERYYVDPSRLRDIGDIAGTGIYVRAYDEQHRKWMSVDISTLTFESLRRWLRSRGGQNPWAENTVGIILGYGPLWEGEDHGT